MTDKELEELTMRELNSKTSELEKILTHYLNQKYDSDITVLEIEVRFTCLDSDGAIVFAPFVADGTPADGATGGLPGVFLDEVFSESLTRYYYYSGDPKIVEKAVRFIVEWINNSWIKLDLHSELKVTISAREASECFFLNESRWAKWDVIYPDAG